MLSANQPVDLLSVKMINDESSINEHSILFVSNCRGRLSSINDLVKKTGATAVVHCGDFGFTDFELQRDKQYHPEDIQTRPELVEYLIGTKSFSVPTFVIYGENDSANVVNKFMNGELIIPKLSLVHERKSFSISLTQANESKSSIPIQIFGLAGGILPSKIALGGSSNNSANPTPTGSPPLPKPVQNMHDAQTWTSLLRIGHLVKESRQTNGDNTMRILVISQPQRHYQDVVAQIAAKLKVDYVVGTLESGNPGAVYNPYLIDPEGTLVSKRNVTAAEFGKWCTQRQAEFESMFSNQQLNLLEDAIAVWSTIEPESEKRQRKTQFVMLPDSVSGNATLLFNNGKVTTCLKSEAEFCETEDGQFLGAIAESGWRQRTERSSETFIPKLSGNAPQYPYLTPIGAGIANASNESQYLRPPSSEEWAVAVKTLTDSNVLGWEQDATKEFTFKHPPHTAIPYKNAPTPLSEVIPPGQTQYWDLTSETSKDAVTHEAMTIWVGNLPEDVTEDDLRVFFRGITIIRIKMSAKRADKRPCAYIDLPDAECLEKALRLSGERLHGSRLKVEYDPSRLKSQVKKDQNASGTDFGWNAKSKSDFSISKNIPKVDQDTDSASDKTRISPNAVAQKSEPNTSTSKTLATTWDSPPRYVGTSFNSGANWDQPTSATEKPIGGGWGDGLANSLNNMNLNESKQESWVGGQQQHKMRTISRAVSSDALGQNFNSYKAPWTQPNPKLAHDNTWEAQPWQQMQLHQQAQQRQMHQLRKSKSQMIYTQNWQPPQTKSNWAIDEESTQGAWNSPAPSPSLSSGLWNPSGGLDGSYSLMGVRGLASRRSVGNMSIASSRSTSGGSTTWTNSAFGLPNVSENPPLGHINIDQGQGMMGSGMGIMSHPQLMQGMDGLVNGIVPGGMVGVPQSWENMANQWN
ncbi:hypothetical protein HK098_002286 [Nowakowskiella sp. JEL0407]|nr:hypothetical protein HK098_002286 [Nowakowskiella sp. JEL0407]